MNPLFLAGANATRHAIMRTISVVCVLSVVALLGFGVHRLLNPKPTESYAQVADAITNYETHNYYDADSGFFLGIKLWGFRLGISKTKVLDVKDEK